MPKRHDLKSIMIIGAGPIVIGQACEFDYSGVQACKALKEEGYRVILVNSNPATIMTDPELADATYIEPITPDILTKIIEIERPSALLPTMGGQTALNAAMKLADDGTLARYQVEMIAAKRDVIAKAEDRLLFKQAMDKIGLQSAKSKLVRNLEEGLAALDYVGLPTVIRPSFTLAGTGGGIAYTIEEFTHIVQQGLRASPVHEVLVEESLLGWKEYEMEVVRDKKDNCIIVCAIENIDPMGVHTGDSITVAPTLTLSDKEYQAMRAASIMVLREIGVDTGGSNVQFALNPTNGRMLVIEMNPRVSRSSALASKATGFPIAYVAAKLAVGYTLDELPNNITRVTPASFEPTIDYVVTKIPRFTFEKFPGCDTTLNTSMKSVGEAMSIGRSFQESLQKGLCSLETGLCGFNDMPVLGNTPTEQREFLKQTLKIPKADRLLYIAEALRFGMSPEEIHALCAYDPWFLDQIKGIIETESQIIQDGLPTSRLGWLALKKMGFSDQRLAQLSKQDLAYVTAQRHQLNVHPVFKRIDTCASEFSSSTNYFYSCYEDDGMGEPECEANPSPRQKVVILGSGPNRIGQGIEFDYCCVHAAYALRDQGFETIMINCNPETVSTDFDTSDRLYFEPITAEHVIEIIKRESQNGSLLGCIIQFGGQTPLKLAQSLKEAQIPILGTAVSSIELAEDRQLFQQLLIDLNLRQPRNGTATTVKQAFAVAAGIGYPVVLRPSFVLGGRAMKIVYDQNDLTAFIEEAVRVSGPHPVLIDQYLTDATEVDVDALADGESVIIAAIMEHIEEAGIHSGDSACSLPAYSLSPQIEAEIERQTILLAKALKVKGLMNIQFAIQDEQIYILEVNPRASRTVPFVAKTTNVPIAKIAAQIMAGKKLADFALTDRPKPSHTAVKEAVFPFARFAGCQIALGPEMKSTGEVMGIDCDFPTAFAKSQLAAGINLPLQGTAFVSVKDKDKQAVVPLAKQLLSMGFSLFATSGTAKALLEYDLLVTTVNKVPEGSPHCVDHMNEDKIHLIINTAQGTQALKDSTLIRSTAITQGIPYYTTIAGAEAAVSAINALRQDTLDVKPIQRYFENRF